MATPKFRRNRAQRVSGLGNPRFVLAYEAMRRALAVDSRLGPCAYCGVPATSIDHVPSRASRQQLVAVGLAGQYRFYSVPACLECNCALGKHGGFTLSARREWVKRWLQRRYQHVLRIPDWSDSELAQAAPAFRNYILKGVVLREWVQSRISYRP